MPRKRSNSGVGRIEFQPESGDGLILRTLDFVRSQLPGWRDDLQRPRQTAEPAMNSTLCDFLDVQSRTGLPMARFKHESPQSARRTVDIGVHGTDETTSIVAADYG